MARGLKKIVITGGPGAGKTTLVNRLHENGYPIIGEPAHIVLDMMAGLLGGQNRQTKWRRDNDGHIVWLQENILRMAEIQRNVLNRLETGLSGNVLFFDRGLHDSLTYFKIHGSSIPKSLIKACDAEFYDLIFILDIPPAAIFNTASGRNTTQRDDAVAMGNMIETTYNEFFPGKVISVPWSDERVELIEDILTNLGY